MNWENFQLWYNYLLNKQYKDELINKAIGEFSLVLTDHKNRFSDFNQNYLDSGLFFDYLSLMKDFYYDDFANNIFPLTLYVYYPSSSINPTNFNYP